MPRTTILLAAWLSLALACATTHRKSRDDLPEKEREVAELQGLLESFEQALSENEFGTAADILEELEAGIKKAGTVTIMHRNYPLVQERVNKAPKKLAAARETFDLEKILTRGQALLAKSAELSEQITSQGPTDDNLDALEETRDQLQQNQEDGKRFQRDARFLDHGAQLKKTLGELNTSLPEHRWALTTTEAINDAISDVPAPEADADTEDRIDAATAAAEAFGECTEVIKRMAKEHHHREDRVLVTRLGSLNLEDSGTLCAQRQAAAIASAQTLTWQKRMGEIAAAVTEALSAVEKAEGPVNIGEASESAAQKLGECEREISGSSGQPGFDPAFVIVSHLGEHPAQNMAAACAKVGRNLNKKLPTLRWRARAEALLTAAKSAEQKLAAAQKETEKDDKTELGQEALTEFKNCSAEAVTLAARKQESLSGAKPSRKELRKIGKLAKSCQKRQGKVKSLLAKWAK